MTASQGLLDAASLGERLDRFGQRLFRLETLPVYLVESDGDDFERWLAGDPNPWSERKRRWTETLRRERATGRRTTRVRILSEQLTDYERYSCEFGYAVNAEAGEEIRVLRRGEHTIPAGVVEHDFWLVDDDEVVVMRYDGRGGFVGAEVAPHTTLSTYLRVRDLAWAAARPFQAWWSSHPELRRRPNAQP
ncbi:MAG: DUF6879 family protein [Pseudonocardia sp.]